MGRLAIGQNMPLKLFTSFAKGFLDNFFTVTTELQVAVGRHDVEIRGHWVMGADIRARAATRIPARGNRE
jgi:hypothetical protein